MFGNFIYFIVVLLIYATWQPLAETQFNVFFSLCAGFGLLAGFAGITWFSFYRIAGKTSDMGLASIDQRFTATVTRLSILAIAVFAVDIYVLNLSAIAGQVPIFSRLPSLEALIFLSLFTLYLVMVWFWAYPVYQQIYKSDLSRREYVRSNLSFSIPVLLPWLCLSGLLDIINILPFEKPRQLLATTWGEISYFLFFLLVITILGPVLIQKFWRCYPLEAGPHRQRVEAICRRAGVQYANILYWPLFGGTMITAAVMGLVQKFRYILVTRGLLQFLSPEEIDSVIAHEIGHIKHHHLLLYLVFFIGYIMLSYVGFDLILPILVYTTPLYRLIDYSGINPADFMTIFYSFVLILTFIIYFRFIFGYFMRNFERQADIYVFSLFESARPLIRAFEKITLFSAQSPDKPNWHHFSISQRMGYLEKCESNPAWINRHNRKIKKSMALYLIALILSGILGYSINFGKIGQNLSNHLVKRTLLQEIARAPDNPDLYGMLGDFYHSRKEYHEAVTAYKKVLQRQPDSSKILNNLAWLLVTCDDQGLRNPAKALDYARRATEIEPAPHILDTLAESYYATGDIEQAIETEQKALLLMPSDRGYYEKQLEKFKKEQLKTTSLKLQEK
jgi:Zn-dependent protease with chaperone function